MEYGEGTIDCLKRECMEELGQEVDIISHFYTTDFFQSTRFIPGKQLISIYYTMQLRQPDKLPVMDQPFDFGPLKEGAMGFRWIDMCELKESDLTFPIDKKVISMLLKQCPGTVTRPKG